MSVTEGAQRPLASGAAERSAAGPLRASLPALVVTAGVVVGLASNQGGYFPSSWGLAGTLLLWTIGLWAVMSGRTDAGRIDVVFLGLFAAFTCWVGLSIAWSIVPAESVLELERTVLVLAGLTAVLVLVRREHVEPLAGVLLAAIAVVSTYSLATRLVPDRLGSYDPVAGYRLSDPVGYWNSLGIFAAMGMLLAVGVATDAKARWGRAVAAAALVPLAATLYYTYSRGSWIALAAGYGACLLVTPRRLRTITTTLVVGAPAAIGVLIGSRPHALTHTGAPLAQSAREGHRVALLLIVLAAVAAGLALALDLVRRRFEVPRSVGIACGAAAIVVLLALVAGVSVREGSPVSISRRAWHAFSTTPPRTGPNLNSRLFSLSGNGRVQAWRAARDLAAAHRVTGSGAGTFERYWQSRNDATFKIRDAHSLYVETFAELGPPGLVLLVGALLVPVAAAFLVRRRSLLPVTLGAYVAFLVHAAVDWDWELSGVTLTALLIGSLLVIAARGRPAHVLGRTVRVVGVTSVVVASMGMVVAYLGNGALARAQSAVDHGSYASAVDDANRARRLMPWSPWPLITRGDAELASRDRRDAAASYRHAIAIDSGEWRAWLGLALASRGHARAAAFARARALYPRSSALARVAASDLKHATNG